MSKNIRGAIGALLAGMLVFSGCATEEKPGAERVDRTPIAVEHYGPASEFTRAARSPSFQAAIDDFEQESGGARVRLSGIRGGVGFRVEHARADRDLEAWNSDYLQKGAFVFRYDNTFGYGGSDAVIVLPTTDKYAVLRAAGTSGPNYDIENGEVIIWLRELEQTDPFVLTEAGPDYLAGRFRHPVRDAGPLAVRMYRFCPDIVDQGTGTVGALAIELEETQALYLWWD